MPEIRIIKGKVLPIQAQASPKEHEPAEPKKAKKEKKAIEEPQEKEAE